MVTRLPSAVREREREREPDDPASEHIAKWIGHSSPDVTSNVYGRLSDHDVQSLLSGVPFLAGSPQRDAERRREEWHRLATFLNQPYVAYDEPPTPPPPPHDVVEVQRVDSMLGSGTAAFLQEVVRRMVQRELAAAQQ